MNGPVVSIVIPTFNRAGPVCRAVDSVLRQSFRDFEVIVVDDGSTDRTRQWLGRFSDARLACFMIPHAGVARARNVGATRARGEWLCFLDSDDVWREHKLRAQLRAHAQNPGWLISQTDDVWIRNSRRVNKMKNHSCRGGDIFAESLKRCLICSSSVMLRMELFVRSGGFDESLPTCEDYDLWLRLTREHPVGFVAQVLVTKFGGHADQLSKAFPVMDHYRLLALEKLLRLGGLSPSQEDLVRREIALKSAIVANGRLKRAGRGWR